MILVVSGKVMNALKAEAQWLKRAEACQDNLEAFKKVLIEFAEAKGFVVNDLDKRGVAF